MLGYPVGAVGVVRRRTFAVPPSAMLGPNTLLSPGSASATKFTCTSSGLLASSFACQIGLVRSPAVVEYKKLGPVFKAPFRSKNDSFNAASNPVQSFWYMATLAATARLNFRKVAGVLNPAHP